MPVQRGEKKETRLVGGGSLSIFNCFNYTLNTTSVCCRNNNDHDHHNNYCGKYSDDIICSAFKHRRNDALRIYTPCLKKRTFIFCPRPKGRGNRPGLWLPGL